MHFSLSTGTMYIYPLRTVFRWAKRTGFDGVEIVINPEAVARGGRAVRQMAEEEGLILFSVHPTVLPLPGWSEPKNGIGPTMAFAQDADARVVVSHTPWTSDLDEGKGLLYRQAIETLLAKADPNGPQLAIENKAFRTKEDWTFALSPLDKLRAFADRYDLGLVLDTTHAGTGGEDLIEARKIMGDRLVNVHLSDMGGPLPLGSIQAMQKYVDQHRFPGSGTLALEDLLADLHASQYNKLVTLEVNPFALQIWWPPAVRRRLDRALSWMKQHTGQTSAKPSQP